MTVSITKWNQTKEHIFYLFDIHIFYLSPKLIKHLHFLHIKEVKKHMKI